MNPFLKDPIVCMNKKNIGFFPGIVVISLLIFAPLSMAKPFSPSEISADDEKINEIDKASLKKQQHHTSKMLLEQAVICEGITNFKPLNPGVVFSISQGNLFCFTAFDPVYKKTTVYHHWYNRDKLVFSMKLILSTPKWSCFSKIQIREADKGPWRVEILNEEMKPIKTLRFSMVD